MRKWLLIFLLISAHLLYANDTLTRAQVYNFNVGDTFDYRTDSFQRTFSPYTQMWVDTNSTSYSRCIIVDVQYSIDSSTKFIVRKWVMPQPTKFDTLTLQNLSGQEVVMDISVCFDPSGGDTIVVDSVSQYHYAPINSIAQYLCFVNSEKLIFVSDLGTVVNIQSGGANAVGYYYDDTTALIYYSKGSETWGTPYYNFLAGIGQLTSADTQITLFPTLNDGTFHVKITDASLLPLTFTAYDVTGREIKQLTLNSPDNNVSIGPCSAGIYIWKALTRGQDIETGKMVVR